VKPQFRAHIRTPAQRVLQHPLACFNIELDQQL
jgi:hypothetical protein